MENHVSRIGTKDKNLYLVTTRQNGKPCWYYIKTSSLQLPLLKEKLKHNDEVDLKDYGNILKQGWGRQPPEYIKRKIIKEGAAYDEREFALDTEFGDQMFHVEQDQNGGFYAYIIVPHQSLNEFLKIVSMKYELDNIKNYGEIIFSGRLPTPPELKASMQSAGMEEISSEASTNP